MKFNGSVVICYGVIVLFGGIIGYLVADSLASLFMGSISGALLIACGLGILRFSLLGFFSAIALSGILTLFFSYRYYMTQKLMPSGGMAVLSFCVLLLLLTTKNKQYIKRDTSN